MANKLAARTQLQNNLLAAQQKAASQAPGGKELFEAAAKALNAFDRENPGVKAKAEAAAAKAAKKRGGINGPPPRQRHGSPTQGSRALGPKRG